MTKHLSSASFLILVLCLLAGFVGSQEPSRQQLANGGMEDGEPGQVPVGWSFNTNCGATAAIVTDQPFAGSRSASVDASQSTGKQGPFTNLMQALDAAPWQGKRVRLRAAVRVGQLPAGAAVQLWMRVDRPDQQVGGFDNMGDRPIKQTTWTQHDIVLDVAADAQRINVGMFVIGKGAAWLDDVTLAIVATDVATTGGAVRQSRSLPPAVAKAVGEAERAPPQPFWTVWLLLPAMAMLLFAFAFWPRRGGGVSGAEARRPGFLRWFALRFTVVYWLLYCLPGPFSQLIPWVGPHLSALYEWMNERLVALTAHAVFGIDGDLVPPNGSGDTTYNHIALWNGFVLALVVAGIWSLLAARRFRYEVLLELLRSYLRYVLAFAMLGYGLAKVTWEQNQFGLIGDWQLRKTWGDCSPMNVLWSFMGTSRAYTVFAGLGEVVAAMLLVWRRTSTLGALVAIGVVTNIVMLNFCYDVPVKLYSSHLLVMAMLIVMQDLGRLTNLLVFDRATEVLHPPNVWSGGVLRWVRRVVKTAVLVVGFAWPMGLEARDTYRHLTAAQTVTASGESAETKPEDQPLLLRRGFRWINEVPFNR